MEGTNGEDSKEADNAEESGGGSNNIEADIITSGAAAEEEGAENLEKTKNDINEGWWFRLWNRLGIRSIARWPQTWPRLFALTFGVATPMFVLICIALFFGFFLAEVESGREIEHNNQVIATRAEVAHNADFLSNVTTEVPRICLSMVVRNQTGDPDFDMQQEIDEELYKIFVRETVRFNTTDENEISSIEEDQIQDVFHFMRGCGRQVWESTEQFTSNTATVNDLDSLSFNWVRCDGSVPEGGNVTTRNFNRVFGSYIRQPFRNRTQLRPDVQKAFVVNEWTRHQQALYEEYLQVNLDMGMDPIDARIAARRTSANDADGFSRCESNPDAGAWFWFTVMTTIGYGNAAPSTTAGRAMVFTLGFLSMLVFAVVLGNSGTIVTAIIDDFVGRGRRLSFLRIPWVTCLAWGILYYIWMVVLAWMTVEWREDRLGEDFSYSDAYWFSFITTTTVGLGDFYLEHQVMLRRDLVSFSLSILLGFVLLANFLLKLTEILVQIFPRKQLDLEVALKQSSVFRFQKKEQRTATSS